MVTQHTGNMNLSPDFVGKYSRRCHTGLPALVTNSTAWAARKLALQLLSLHTTVVSVAMVIRTRRVPLGNPLC